MSRQPERSAPTRSLLLVEDDREQAELLRRWLEADGRATVVHVSTGHGARFQLQRAPRWDAVISDVSVPGCDGLDVLRFAKARHPQTPILMITARPDVTTAVAALRSRADEFLVKPVERDVLLGKVEELITRSRQQQPPVESVLAIGAHPDDVEIGCGGVLLGHTARGDRVTILTLSCGEQGGEADRRRLESDRAARLVGAELLLHNLPDARISEGRETIGLIEDAIRSCQPTTIYTHTPNDGHQDHRNVYRATIVAARSVPNVYCYQSPSSTTEFRPTRFVDVTAQLARKIGVLEAFESQFHKRSYLSPDLIRATADYWGRFAGYRQVEPLEVVRSTR